MAKSTSATITVLPTSSLVFGGHVDYSVSPAISVAGQPYVASVRLDVTGAGGVALQEGFSGNGGTVNPDGLGGSFPLGPTPAWTSGGGTGTLTYRQFDSRKGAWVDVRGSAVTFTISA